MSMSYSAFSVDGLYANIPATVFPFQNMKQSDFPKICYVMLCYGEEREMRNIESAARLRK